MKGGVHVGAEKKEEDVRSGVQYCTVEAWARTVASVGQLFRSNKKVTICTDQISTVSDINSCDGS